MPTCVVLVVIYQHVGSSPGLSSAAQRHVMRFQVPVTAVLTPGGNTLTTNPVWVADSFNGTSGLHFLFAPDSNNGSVVVTRPVTA